MVLFVTCVVLRYSCDRVRGRRPVSHLFRERLRRHLVAVGRVGMVTFIDHRRPWEVTT